MTFLVEIVVPAWIFTELPWIVAELVTLPRHYVDRARYVDSRSDRATPGHVQIDIGLTVNRIGAGLRCVGRGCGKQRE